MHKLTLVTGFRDRDLNRVKRFLDSLRIQSISEFNVIIVDYGSRTALADKLKALIEKYDFCRYIYADTRGYPWNRSHALNIGCRIVETDFVMTTDIDMVFGRNFVETVLDKVDEKRVVYSQVYWMPRHFREWENLENYKEFPVSDKNGRGGCCVVATEVLRSLGGFDEFYRFWGVEDEDLYRRLMTKSLEEMWLPDIMIYHQWHQVNSSESTHFMPVGMWGRMATHLVDASVSPVRNGENWGFAPLTKERKVFEYIDVDSNSLKKGDDLSYFDYVPGKGFEESGTVLEFVSRFRQMKAGHCIAVNNTLYPQINGFFDRIFRKLNSILQSLGINSGIDFRINRLKTELFNFIIDNEKSIADYYMDFPAEKGITLIVKR